MSHTPKIVPLTTICQEEEKKCGSKKPSHIGLSGAAGQGISAQQTQQMCQLPCPKRAQLSRAHSPAEKMDHRAPAANEEAKKRTTGAI